MTLPIRAGDVVHLAEPDYRFGRGRLTLRVTGPPLSTPEPEWVELHGIEVAWNGREVGERVVQVRVAALGHRRTYERP
jgi:hypothetical protein